MNHQPRQQSEPSNTGPVGQNPFQVGGHTSSESPVFGGFSDRSCSARRTLARLRPHFKELGISRLGDLTGLDSVGIPVAMAVRPNSNSLSVSLGKGPDPDSAFISAAMEAAETSVAETLPNDISYHSIDELRGTSRRFLDIEDVARCHPRLLPAHQEIGWVSGTDLSRGKQILVPWALVGLDHRDKPEGYNDAFYVASDGLASGNTKEEAVFHGLCELIERDALFNFQFADRSRISELEFSVTGDEDTQLPELLRRISVAGLELRLFQMQSDTGIPAFLALLEAKHHRHFSASAQGNRCGGCGCHPDAGRAIVKAITEAAQARLALVAGARDDIRSEHYAADSFMSLDKPFRANANPVAKSISIPGIGRGKVSLGHATHDLIERLAAIGIRQLVSVEMDARRFGIHVVRVVSDQLQVPLEGKRVQITSRGFSKMQEMSR